MTTTPFEDDEGSSKEVERVETSAAAALDPSRCTARRSTDGGQCQNFPIRGHHVCRYHGGAAPLVRRTAQQALQDAKERLLIDLSPKAVRVLEEIVDDETASNPDRIRASTAILDRAGLGPGQTIDLTTGPREAPPADLLKAALDGVRSRLEAAGVITVAQVEGPVEGAEDVVDAEVIPFPGGPNLDDLL